jgi:hypothetical protein
MYGASILCLKNGGLPPHQQWVLWSGLSLQSSSLSWPGELAICQYSVLSIVTLCSSRSFHLQSPTCGIRVRYAGSSAHAALCIRAVLLTESLFGLLVCTSFSTKLHTDTPSIETGLVTSVAALCLIVFVSDQTYGVVECNIHLTSVGHHARQRSMGCCPLGLRQM